MAGVIRWHNSSLAPASPLARIRPDNPLLRSAMHLPALSLSVRRLAAAALLLSAFFALRADDPFSSSRSKYQYGRQRKFDFIHLELHVTLDPAKKEIRGEAIYTLAPLAEPQTRVALDAEDLTLDGAEAAGAAAKAHATENEFIVELPRAYAAGESLEIRVKYHGRPRKGIFFYGPDEIKPDRPISIWTQGEDEDNHFWFPCYDYPNDKLTSDTYITLPAKFVAISNGKLLETKQNGDGTATWIWSEKVKHSSYLISLVAGDYEKFHQEWKGMDVDAWVPRGRLPEAERSFGRTPEMIEFFSTITGVKYPYEKFSQEAVPEFIYGGMENVSAVTQTDRTLHPAHLEEEESSDGLVAHELAHQWFGDLVTTQDWSNAWLNEGFATYFETLWTEHRKGADEFHWELEGNRRAYIGETRQYRRAIVTHSFVDPTNMFDSHTYPKGGWVLHMLRRELGDAVFFGGIRKYLEKFRESNVDSDDFRKTMAEAAGRNLDQFFDQWVFHPGHPELDVQWRYDDALGAGQLTVKQKQKTEDGTRVFRCKLTLELLYDEGGERQTVELSDKSHEFTLKAKARPVAVLIDPDGDLLKSLSYDPGENALRVILARADSPVQRADAAKLLGDKHPAEANVEALKKALTGDKFWGVRAVAAEALAKHREPAQRGVVLAAVLAEKNGRARYRMTEALGQFRRDRGLIPELKKIADSDVSDNVRAAALGALGEIDAPGEFEYLKSKTAVTSHHQVIRHTVFTVWSEHDERRAIPLLLDATLPGRVPETRGSAARALGSLGRDLDDKVLMKKIRERLVEMIDDPQFRTRSAAMGALGELADPAAIPALKAAEKRMWDGRQREDALDAVEEINSRDKQPGELAELRKSVQELKDDKDDLKKRLDEMDKAMDALKEKVKAADKDAKPAAPEKPASAPETKPARPAH
jgi:aminopeptidase N